MNKMLRTTPVIIAITIIAACHHSKKTTTNSQVVAAQPPPVAPAPKVMLPEPRPHNGVYVPGDEELTAIREVYNEVTMPVLTQGYALYTGVCTNCHEPKSIYSRPRESWQGIVDDMAYRSRLNETEKDAVLKYVLSIKAIQLKNGK